jgi:hypothetical protein
MKSLDYPVALCAPGGVIRLKLLLESLRHRNMVYSILVATLIMHTSAQSASCLSLQDSSVCPSFAAYSVYRGTNNSQGFAKFNSVASFDQYVQLHLLNSSLSTFNTEQSCKLTDTLYVPFLASTICGIINSKCSHVRRHWSESVQLQ